MQLTFLGAAGTVTGSRFLLEHEGRRILVDCGLFQGLKELRLRNWAPFPVDPSHIDAVVLTHAHLDHSGYLPLLVRNGFSGPVYCTEATRALCGLLLPDAAFLEEEAAERANRKGYSKHRPAQPLYTRRDAAVALQALVPVDFDSDVALENFGSFRYTRAGHLLGAAFATFHAGGRTIVFSGDVGRSRDALFPAPEPLPGTDYLIAESTYGNREHPERDPRDALADIVGETVARGGVMIVPSFAIGRAQTVLLNLAELHRAGRIPRLPVFLDSPMAAEATEFFFSRSEDHHLTPDQSRAMQDLVSIARTPEDSKAIDARRGPMIIISASGMMTGGRVLHHVARFGGDDRNTILMPGYQAAGTRGAALVAGARTLRMHGQEVPIRARVVVLDGLSGHADATEMIEWFRTAPRAPSRTFLTHGEPKAASALAERMRAELGWTVSVPRHEERVTLD